jgi:opacity protein-like surface antigen
MSKQTNFKPGVYLGAAIGKKFSNFRIELTPFYLKNKRKEQPNSLTKSLATFSTLGNFYYDFPVTYNFTPYLGIGAGFSKLTNSPSITSAYQTIVGTSYALTRRLGLIMDYRYLQTSNLKPIDCSIKSHLINMGIKYKFN